MDVYNQWINLDIKKNSRISFKIIEIVVVYIITNYFKRISNNEELNRHVHMYPIDQFVKYISGWLEGKWDEFGDVVNATMKFRKTSASKQNKQ